MEKIGYVLKIAIVAFLFNYVLMLGLEFINDVFRNLLGVMKYSIWIYTSLFLAIAIIVLAKVKRTLQLNYYKLFGIKMALSILLGILMFIIDIYPFWNIHDKLYSYTLIDDEIYYENDYADTDDPVFGIENSGEYYATLKYFINHNESINGLVFPQGKVEFHEKAGYLIEQNDGEYITLNIRNAIFWQYALSKGYRPLINGQFERVSFLSRIYKIAPFYLLESILKNCGNGIFLALITILILLLKKGWLLNIEN